ncbi:hypothetical protein [Chryseobacterium sp. PMSZPI]|uniref:hypothetical protein n=1 Tax=Chryseobacterium sp. PMSZPI TaxID=1033900 RepID=UPI000C34F64F|nr:hypothetical protein [Chryseobacterium sp. PMSZPI]PKF75556.1 hypothetical protein CW752_03420 [Chryseobacterium sp. PMSZPI]
MKKLTLILFLMVAIFAFGQKCNYTTAVNSENLKQTGKFKLLIRNNDEKSLKISKELIFCNMRLEKLEFYNERTKTFEAAHIPKKDIDCFTYHNKAINLRPGQTYIYDIDIKSDFDVLQSNKFFEKANERKYRFKLTFSVDDYDRCGESNTLITDWIYKN